VAFQSWRWGLRAVCLVACGLWVAPALAAITVTNTNDDGPGSLRQAIAEAMPNETIVLSVIGTIALTTVAPSTLANLDVGKSLTIQGPGADRLTIAGSGAVAVFRAAPGAVQVEISGVTISGGTAGLNGPGDWTLIRGIVSGNDAGFDGSGAWTVIDSIIAGNSTGLLKTTDAGAILVIRSTLSGNTAKAIHNESSLVLINSTVSSNGKGLDNDAGNSDATVLSSTIVANEFAGIENAGQVNIANSIVAANGPNCTGNALTSQGFNLEDADTCGLNPMLGDLINTNPLLGPLKFNGGPTRTHALVPGSPAVDAANPGGCRDQDGNLLETCQRGFARQVDFPTGTFGRCDIGAYELQPTTGAPVLGPLALLGMVVLLLGLGTVTLWNARRPRRAVAEPLARNRPRQYF
jgi:hypothetical protein